MDKLSVFSGKANMAIPLTEIGVGCDVDFIKPDAQWFDRNWSDGWGWSNGNTWAKGWLNGWRNDGWSNGGK
ncbi:MAG: hypothetical protein K6F53_03655 [Lachnospiraceae bacterium]|nr:hypothetical protein [Lachnospiraceae bacterium]